MIIYMNLSNQFALEISSLVFRRIGQGCVAAGPTTITGAFHCQPFPEERWMEGGGPGGATFGFFWPKLEGFFLHAS